MFNHRIAERDVKRVVWEEVLQIASISFDKSQAPNVGTGGFAPPGAEPDDEGGCGCRLEATRMALPRWAVLGLLGLGLVFVGRRKSKLGRAA